LIILILIFLFEASDKNQVYEKLKKIEHADVYLKEDVPEELHIKNNVRSGDIMIIAKLGYLLFPSKSHSYPQSKSIIFQVLFKEKFKKLITIFL
jgi:hypothetical protein